MTGPKGGGGLIAQAHAFAFTAKQLPLTNEELLEEKSCPTRSPNILMTVTVPS